MTDPTGKIVVTLETRDEDEIVAAMNAMQHMTRRGQRRARLPPDRRLNACPKEPAP